MANTTENENLVPQLLTGPQHTFTEDLRRVELDFTAEHIIVERGSEEVIRLEQLDRDGDLYEGDHPMEVWVSGSTLHARRLDERRSLIGSLKDEKCVRLTLPGSYTGTLRIEANCGTVQVKKIHAASLQTDVKSGSLCVESCSFSEKLELESASGSVTVSDVDCPEADITAHSGTMRTERLFCDVLHAQTHSGAQKHNAAVKQEAVLEALSGSIHLTGEVCELRTETRSGSQKFDVDTLKNARMSAKSGSLYLKVQKPDVLREIDVTTMSGSIHLYLPGDVRPLPQLETRSGSQHFTSADFSKTAGDVYIHASTLSGSLSIRPVQQG